MKAYRLQFTSFDGFPLEAICKTPEECLLESEYAQSRCWGNTEEIEVPDNYFDEE